MANCEREDTFNANITGVSIIQHRFNAGGGEIKLEFQIDEELGNIYLDLSADYIQKGNNQGKRAVDVTQETLRNLGVSLFDKTQLQTLVGRSISVYGQRNGKYLNFYISSRKPEVKMTDTEYDQYIQQLFGTPQAQQVAPAPQAPVAPFPQQVAPAQPPAGNATFTPPPQPNPAQPNVFTQGQAPANGKDDIPF